MKTLLSIFRIQGAMRCNRIIFWCKRIPLVKRLLSDGLYAAAEGKTALTVVIAVFSGLYSILGKFVYLFLCCVLPLYLFTGPASLAAGFPQFLWILFFLSFAVGCFLQSDILTPNLLKYTCVRQMGMEAKLCVAATTGKTHVVTFLTFTFALMVAAALFGRPLWVGVLLSAELASFRLMAEGLFVLLFDKWNRQPCKSVWFIIFVMLGGLMAAYIPVLVGVPLAIDAVLLNPIFAAGILLLGALCGVFLVCYPSYRALIRKTCRPENITSAAAKQNAALAAFKDVQMKESDLKATPASPGIAQKKGFDYLNALFFQRHRRLIWKPAKYQLIGIGIALALGLVLCVLFRDVTRELLSELPKSLPFFVFLMYFSANTIGMRACKAMFYNCDNSLLKFGWYRSPSVVLKNFTVRLKRITALNLLVAGSLCAGMVLLSLACGVPLASRLETWVPFLFAILCLAVFFSVHPLFMYYVFQPYSAALAVKNPFFRMINGAVYMVCILCLQIRRTPTWFALIVLVATILYCAVALLMVWKRAPKTFRVK